MAENYPAKSGQHPINRILQILKLEKNEITAIYFYAILNGLIQLSLPLGIQSIIGFVLGGAISSSLVILITLVVTGVFFNGYVSVSQLKLIEKIQQKLFVRYAFEYADRIPRLDLKSVDRYYLPELVNRFFDTVSLQKGISKLLLDIPTASIQILFGMLLLSFYHPAFIVFSVLLIALVAVVLYYSSPNGMATSLRESAYKYRVAGWLEELGRVIRSFKFSKGTRLNLKRTDQLVSGYLEARTSHFRILLFQYWTLIICKVLITAAMLIVGSILVINQQLNLGQFIAAEIVILLVLNSVEKLILNLDKVYDTLTSVEKLGKITDQAIDPDGKLSLADKPEGVTLVADHLGFYYDKKKVLHDISFTVSPGQKVAITGKEGAGKSTLLRVLTGVYHDFDGSIIVDEIPIRNYDSQSLRNKMGILLSQQDIFLGTLLENITLGDESISPREIAVLAGKIGMKDFLDNLESGFDTLLDPVGNKLSANVIRKILLLRALIHHPRLLLLEEPWAGLDDSNKNIIQDYLLNQCGKSTMIIVTSDEHFIHRCDQVIYLEDGKIQPPLTVNDNPK